MESNNFRKLLLIFALIIIIPVINSLYGTISALITTPVVIIAIILTILYFATRTETKAISKGICRDIKSIDIKVSGRNYIISEGAAFNTEDFEQPGILSYIENGTWFISDDPEQTAKDSMAEITIPKGIILDSLNINVLSGNVFIASAAADKTDISVSADSAQLKSLITTSLHASAGKGKLSLNTKLDGNALLECGSGTLDISLECKDTDFNIDATTGAGTISINEKTVFDSSNRNGKISNVASRTIKANCGLGQINISFAEVSNDEQE